ncbi:MAG: hypothetical protein ACHQRJ_15125 [Alphaproteobacteria bacterium]
MERLAIVGKLILETVGQDLLGADPLSVISSDPLNHLPLPLEEAGSIERLSLIGAANLDGHTVLLDGRIVDCVAHNRLLLRIFSYER